MSVIASLVGLSTTLLGGFMSSETKEKREAELQRAKYYYEQRILLGVQHSEYLKYVQQNRLTHILKTVVLPTFVILYLFYLFNSNKI